MKELIDEHNCSFLSVLYDKYVKTCKVCGWENTATFKNNIPFYWAKCRRCLTRKQEQEQQEKQEQQEQQNKRDKVEEVLTAVDDSMCKCGLLKEHVCCCINGSYHVMNINKQFWCEKCDKWKCRCPN